MSKNKKKDIWDLTPEEQMDNANNFYKFEKGKIGIMELGNIPKTLNDNGLTGDVEARIVADLMGERKTEIIPPVNYTEKIEKNSVYGETKNSDEPSKTINELTGDTELEQADKEDVVDYINDAIEDEINDENTNDEIPNRVEFVYDNEVNKFFVDDGIVSSVLSLPVVASQDIVGAYDADDINDIIKILYKYIISLKHPTAIFDVDDFYSNNAYKFDKVKTYNKDKFVFLYHDTWVYCYIIDNEGVDELNKLLEYIIGDDLTNYLKFYVSLAYACGSLNGAFFVEDEEFVNKYYHSSYNNKEGFISEFGSDSGTILITEEESIKDDEGIFPDPATLPWDENDVKELQMFARGKISSLTGSSYFGDDEEDWDDDDDELDDNTDDVVDSDSVVDNDLLSPDMEVIKSNEPVDIKHQENIKDSLSEVEVNSHEEENKSSDNSLVIDVITKKVQG